MEDEQLRERLLAIYAEVEEMGRNDLAEAHWQLACGILAAEEAVANVLRILS